MRSYLNRLDLMEWNVVLSVNYQQTICQPRGEGLIAAMVIAASSGP
jgi:hypothetical protein